MKKLLSFLMSFMLLFALACGKESDVVKPVKLSK
jgi:predicted small lipoprotein YifL